MYLRDVLGISSPKSHTSLLLVQSAVVVAVFIDSLSGSLLLKSPFKAERIEFLFLHKLRSSPPNFFHILRLILDLTMYVSV